MCGVTLGSGKRIPLYSLIPTSADLGREMYMRVPVSLILYWLSVVHERIRYFIFF